MGAWTAIVLIVLIGAIVAIKRGQQATEYRSLKEQEAALLDKQAQPSREEQALQDEVSALKERIKVLERIATEDLKARRLSAEIEDLRKD